MAGQPGEILFGIFCLGNNMSVAIMVGEDNTVQIRLLPLLAATCARSTLHGRADGADISLN